MNCRDGSVGTADQTAPTNGYEPSQKIDSVVVPIYVAYQVIKQDEVHRKSVRIPILLLANDLRASRIRVRSHSAAAEPGFDPGHKVLQFFIQVAPFHPKRPVSE